MVPISPIRHPSPPAAFTVAAWSLLALWVFSWLAGPTMLSLLDLALNTQGHAPLRAHGPCLWMTAVGGACPTRWTC